MTDKIIRKGKEIQIRKSCPVCNSKRFVKIIGIPRYTCKKCKYVWGAND